MPAKKTKQAYAKDKKYTSQEKHEQAYKKKRVSKVTGYKKSK